MATGPNSTSSPDAPNPIAWWRAHTPAILTGLAAILAAAVAGYWPSSASRQAAREESVRLADVRSEDARGASRILINEFLIASHKAKDLAYGAIMRPLDSDFKISIPQADLRLVASHLNTDNWTEINHALSDAANLDGYLKFRSRLTHPLSGQPLSRHSVQILFDDVSSFGDAMEALADLAKITDLAVPTFDPEDVNVRIERFANDEGLKIPE